MRADSTLFVTAARRLLDRIDEQADAIGAVADAWADAIAADGLVHLFGTGHSRIPVEEMFPRYGSYPGFNPIVELSMTYHTQVVGSNGQRQAMFIERIPGPAEAILSNYELRPQDVMIVFSASGLSAVPIEMALGARRRGLTVVAVTSVAQSQAGTPTHEAGRLLDNADIVLDLCTPPGDALVEIDGGETPRRLDRPTPHRSHPPSREKEGQLKGSFKAGRLAIALIALVAIAVTAAVSASGKTQAKYVLGVSNTLVGNGWREEMICAVK